ncbi:hypothetical protein HI914_02242, partial [Erysiphe necator]
SIRFYCFSYLCLAMPSICMVMIGSGCSVPAGHTVTFSLQSSSTGTWLVCYTQTRWHIIRICESFTVSNMARYLASQLPIGYDLLMAILKS